MGFYGNVTQANRTTFTFDKIYLNRKTMINMAENDGVFIGRYVLVEYDQDANTFYHRLYIRDNKFYWDFDTTEETRARYNSSSDFNIKPNEIIYTMTGTGGKEPKITYWRCSGADDKESKYAKFEQITSGTAVEGNPYLENYLIDGATGRGYDSTVWQKVFKQGEATYINVAELNSVVPTFDLVVDPPTDGPSAPHFDSDSTDVYYKLHV
jgi:hypothetical protein